MKTFNLNKDDDFRVEKQKHKEEINQLKSVSKRIRKNRTAYIDQLKKENS